VSTIGLISTRHEYQSLFAIYVPIALGVFVVILLAVLGCVLRYRRRPEAARFSEHNPLEASYAVLLTLVVAFLLYLTYTAEHKVDTVAARETPAVTIDLTAAKWEWQFTYPQYGITVRSGTVGLQPLVLPENQAIRFNMVSQDVIHSFWVPELDFKRDVIPGITERITLTFTHTGLFPGQCAEFCGLRHAEMIFNVRVLSDASFAAWARSHRGFGE
jgi:cytochrome c oxidase subunit II